MKRNHRRIEKGAQGNCLPATGKIVMGRFAAVHGGSWWVVGASRLDNSKGVALLAEVLRDLQTAGGTSMYCVKWKI